jgi:hypothetical protein
MPLTDIKRMTAPTRVARSTSCVGAHVARAISPLAVATCARYSDLAA